jgi:methyltransferase-like protein
VETIKCETIYKIVDGVRSREEAFGILVVSKNTPALSLNMDSKFVWKLIDGSRTAADIIKLVFEEYGGNDVTENTKTLLEDLLKLGLIVDVN